MSKAIDDVIAERQRQENEEGWTPAHDDTHDPGDLASAAAAYAREAAKRLGGSKRGKAPAYWPWYADNDISGGWGKPIHAWWKPTNPRRDLVKSAALILAEIDRIDRLTRLEAARKVELPDWATHVAVRLDGSHAEPAVQGDSPLDFRDAPKGKGLYTGYIMSSWVFIPRAEIQGK